MSIPLIIGLVLFLIMGGAFVALGAMPAKKRLAFFKNLYKNLFEFFSNNFITGASVRKITRKISMLSVYRTDQIPEITVHTFMSAALISLLIMLAGVFLMNDLIATILCIVFGFIVNNVMIDKQLDKTHLKVLKEAARTLSSIEQEYMKNKNIPDSLANAETGNMLRKAIDDIYNILMGSNGELQLQQFCAAMPFRPLQTLAGICYNLNFYGDSVDDMNISGFVKAITILRGDINEQIEKYALQRAKFGVMEYMPLVPILGIGPLENYFIDIIPGVALMYNGALGYILRTLVIVSAIVSYMVISRINSMATVKDDDRGGWTQWLLRRRLWRLFVCGLIPKNEKTGRKLKFKLKQALSRMNLEHYYTKKAVFAAFFFAVTLAALFIAVSLGSDYMKNSTAQLSLVAGTERSQREQQAMKVMDEIYFEAKGKLSENEHRLLIRRYLPGLSDMQMLDEMKRMQDKYSTWQSLYFRWQYVWAAFVFGMFGWFLPGLMVKGRTFIVKTETEDDYMQLQTLVSILVYTGIDTLSVLQQMVQQSTVHQDILLHAYHSFPSAPELELERLRSKITLPDFKWFIDKLKLTISELPMSEAFSDLISERENFMRLRRIAMESTLAKKKTLCSFLAMFPVIAFAVGEFLVPLGYLGIMEFQNALTMIR